MSSTWQKKAVAVTGIFASGKSSVCEIFEELGAFVINADELAKKPLESNHPTVKLICDEFGEDLKLADGSIDRVKLSDIVFSDSNKLKTLESIVHPEVRKLAEIEAKKASPNQLIIYDCPLFFESGLQSRGFKKIIVVTASIEQCIERAIKRTGLTEEEVRQRIDKQIPLSEKEGLSDIVIDNTGSLGELRKKVESIYKNL